MFESRSLLGECWTDRQGAWGGRWFKPLRHQACMKVVLHFIFPLVYHHTLSILYVHVYGIFGYILVVIIHKKSSGQRDWCYGPWLVWTHDLFIHLAGRSNASLEATSCLKLFFFISRGFSLFMQSAIIRDTQTKSQRLYFQLLHTGGTDSKYFCVQISLHVIFMNMVHM